MGLNHPVQFLGQAREVDSTRWPWPKAPQVERRWFAVVAAEQPEALEWRRETLKESLNGIDLHCVAAEAPELAPLEVHRGYVRRGDDFMASLVLRQWPREVAAGWLGRALSGETPVDVGLHFAPKDPQQFARYLKKQQTWQAGDLAKKPDAAAALGHRDAYSTQEKLIAGLDRPCRVAIVLTVHAPSLDQLHSRLQTTMYDIGLALAHARPINLEHDRGCEATEPTGRCNVVGAWRALDCTSVATTGIFQPPTINHIHGVDIGTTHNVGSFHKGSQLVRLDPFDDSLEGFSGVVIGKKRMGKSYFMKVLARAMARLQVEVTIVEQRRPPEYGVLAREQHVTVVNIEEIGDDFDEPDVAAAKRVAFLRNFTTEYWNRCRADPRPRMFIVDEAWALLKDAQSANWIEQVARTGGHFGLSFWVLSQQVREFLATGQAALDNAEIIVCLKQLENDLGDDLGGLAKAIGMPQPARVWLSGALPGQCLFKVGELWLAVDVARVPEHYEITTDPRDFWTGRVDSTRDTVDSDDEEDSNGVGDAPGKDRAADSSSGRLWLPGRSPGRSDPSARPAVPQ